MRQFVFVLSHSIIAKFRVIDGFDALDELETIKVDAKYRPVVEQRYRLNFVRLKSECFSTFNKLFSGYATSRFTPIRLRFSATLSHSSVITKQISL